MIYRTRRAELFVVGSAIVLSAAPVHAQDDRKQVVKLVQKYVELGETLFHSGEHADAAAAFRKAVDALEKADLPVPAPLHRSIARCHEQSGDVPKAIAAYEEFLEMADADDERLARRIKDARHALQRLSLALARTALRFDVSPASATLTLDGKPLGHVPEGDLPVSPGPHVVVLAAKGHETLTLDLDVGTGSTAPVVAKLSMLASIGQSAGPQGRGGDWRPWALAGGGTALMLGALVMQGSALSSASQAGAKASDGEPQGDVNTLHSEATTAQFLAVGLGVTALALLGGATWMWLGDSEPAAVGLGPAGVRLQATF